MLVALIEPSSHSPITGGAPIPIVIDDAAIALWNYYLQLLNINNKIVFGGLTKRGWKSSRW